MIDYLIVGAGITGATLARELTDAGKSVLVIDKRAHIGGNVYTERRHGVLMSLYGGHIFHTNSRRIWDYTSRFTEWQQYEHRVKVEYKGVIYSFPPNLMTLQQMGIQPSRDIEPALREIFFNGYTEKQWGRPINEVPQDVISRIPIRFTWDDRYFSDRWQGLPEHGYTPMIGAMLHGIDVELERTYTAADTTRAHNVILTGPIDEYFNHDKGMLEYRSLRFEIGVISGYNQGCATLNYAQREIPYTRRMQWSYFWRTPKHLGVVTTEYPEKYTGRNEPYYPIETAHNRSLYDTYARRLPGNVIPAGRLGTYRYLNMDQAIGAALTLAERLTK